MKKKKSFIFFSSLPLYPPSLSQSCGKRFEEYVIRQVTRCAFPPQASAKPLWIVHISRFTPTFLFNFQFAPPKNCVKWTINKTSKIAITEFLRASSSNGISDLQCFCFQCRWWDHKTTRPLHESWKHRSPSQSRTVGWKCWSGLHQRSRRRIAPT